MEEDFADDYEEDISFQAGKKAKQSKPPVKSISATAATTTSTSTSSLAAQEQKKKLDIPIYNTSISTPSADNYSAFNMPILPISSTATVTDSFYIPSAKRTVPKNWKAVLKPNYTQTGSAAKVKPSVSTYVSIVSQLSTLIGANDYPNESY